MSAKGDAEDILGGGARYVQWSTSQHLDILVLCALCMQQSRGSRV